MTSAGVPILRPRLRPTAEVLEASDGHVYLIAGGGRPDHAIRNAPPAVRALLASLDGSRDAAELAASLAAAGHIVDRDAISAAIADLAALGLVEDAALEPPGELRTEELERYDRQLAYFADAAEAGDRWDCQLRLRSATVAIIGVGGLGTWAASGLASAGVGRLVLVDPDRVELSNLNRQVLFRRSDVGRPKVRAAAEALHAFNPELEIVARATAVDGPAAAAAVAGADFVVATADHPPHLIGRWLNAACVRQGIAYIAAGQLPPTIRIGPTYLPGRTGCLECQERGIRDGYPLYDELVAARAGRPSYAATLGPASGMIGATIAMEVTHALSGVCEPATAGAALVIDLRTLEQTREPVVRDADCPVCGSAPAGIGPADIETGPMITAGGAASRCSAPAPARAPRTRAA